MSVWFDGAGTGLVVGSVATYALLPAAVGEAGKMYYVTTGSGGVLSIVGMYKYPAGLYYSDGATWTLANLQVKVAEDSTTLVNIPDWAGFVSIAPTINTGDRIVYNNLQYKNLSGTYGASAPSADSTNWSLADASLSNSLLKNPSGFTDPDNIVVTYDSTTKKVTLTGNVEAYYQGVKIGALVSGWTSAAIPASPPTQPWYLYYDGTNFVWSTTIWAFDMVQIAYVYYRADGTYIFSLRECHGMMPWEVHRALHQTIGTYKVSGGTLGSYVLNSNTAANRRPSNDATTIRDEDLTTTNPLRSPGNYTHAYLTGTNTIITDWNNADIVKLNGANPYWNQFTGGAWQQTLMTNNSYMCIWVLAFPAAADSGAQRYTFFYLQGQSEGTLASQQALTPNSVSLGLLANISPEFIFLNRIIIQFTAADWKIVQVDNYNTSRFSLIGLQPGA